MSRCGHTVNWQLNEAGAMKLKKEVRGVSGGVRGSERSQRPKRGKKKTVWTTHTGKKLTREKEMAEKRSCGDEGHFKKRVTQWKKKKNKWGDALAHSLLSRLDGSFTLQVLFTGGWWNVSQTIFYKNCMNTTKYNLLSLFRGEYVKKTCYYF